MTIMTVMTMTMTRLALAALASILLLMMMICAHSATFADGHTLSSYHRPLYTPSGSSSSYEHQWSLADYYKVGRCISQFWQQNFAYSNVVSHLGLASQSSGGSKPPALSLSSTPRSSRGALARGARVSHGVGRVLDVGSKQLLPACFSHRIPQSAGAEPICVTDPFRPDDAVVPPLPHHAKAAAEQADHTVSGNNTHVTFPSFMSNYQQHGAFFYIHELRTATVSDLLTAGTLRAVVEGVRDRIDFVSCLFVAPMVESDDDAVRLVKLITAKQPHAILFGAFTTKHNARIMADHIGINATFQQFLQQHKHHLNTKQQQQQAQDSASASSSSTALPLPFSYWLRLFCEHGSDSEYTYELDMVNTIKLRNAFVSASLKSLYGFLLANHVMVLVRSPRAPSAAAASTAAGTSASSSSSPPPLSIAAFAPVRLADMSLKQLVSLVNLESFAFRLPKHIYNALALPPSASASGAVRFSYHHHINYYDMLLSSATALEFSSLVSTLQLEANNLLVEYHTNRQYSTDAATRADDPVPADAARLHPTPSFVSAARSFRYGFCDCATTSFLTCAAPRRSDNSGDAAAAGKARDKTEKEVPAPSEDELLIQRIKRLSPAQFDDVVNQLYLTQQHDHLSMVLLRRLQHYVEWTNEQCGLAVTHSDTADDGRRGVGVTRIVSSKVTVIVSELDAFLRTFLYVLSQRDFSLSRDVAAVMVMLNEQLGELVQLSNFQTTHS